jgi:hypothetical protein
MVLRTLRLDFCSAFFVLVGEVAKLRGGRRLGRFGEGQSNDFTS